MRRRWIVVLVVGVALIAGSFWIGVRVYAWLVETTARAMADQLAEEEREAPSVFGVRLGETAGKYRKVEGAVRNNGSRAIAFVK